MNVGDKVRMLHGSESGTIVKLIDKQLVEVEIEDGFRIPVLKTEIVRISSDEAGYFSGEKSESTAVSSAKKNIPKSKTEEGLLLAVSSLNDHIRSFFLVNNTSYNINYTLAEEYAGLLRPLRVGQLTKGAFIKLTERSTHDITNWLPFHLQVQYFSDQNFTFKSPEIYQFTIKAKALTKAEEYLSMIDKKALVFPLKEKVKSKLDADMIKEMLFEHSEASLKETPQKSRINAAHEVDLHIEQIVPNHHELKPEEILSVQFRYFEEALDQAISQGIDEVVFIHGVGNGVLKNKIHKYLGQHQNVRFFKDAQKEKFGYGATLAKIQ